MKNRNIIRTIISLILITIFTITASAHSTSQEGILGKSYHQEKHAYFIGGDEAGWMIDETTHTNGTHITYSFDYNDPYVDGIISATNNGANLWTQTGVVTISHVQTGGTGTIRTYTDSDDDAAAIFTNCSANSIGHLTYWEIQVNRSNPFNSVTLAHEFGHAIGLLDLYGTISVNKLMYHRQQASTTGPTENDKWGAKVITGQHTSHTWGYKYHSNNSTGNLHRAYCTICNGFAATTERCTYNAKNICVKCKTPKGYAVQNVEHYDII